MGSMLPYTAYMDPMGMCVCLCSAQQNPGCIPAGRDFKQERMAGGMIWRAGNEVETCWSICERLVSQWHPVLMSLNLPISGRRRGRVSSDDVKMVQEADLVGDPNGGGQTWTSLRAAQTDSRPADPREILQHSHHVVSCLLAHFLFVQKFRLCLMDICSSTKSSAVSHMR